MLVYRAPFGRQVIPKEKVHICHPPSLESGYGRSRPTEPLGSIWKCDDCGQHWIVDHTYWQRITTRRVVNILRKIDAC